MMKEESYDLREEKKCRSCKIGFTNYLGIVYNQIKCFYDVNVTAIISLDASRIRTHMRTYLCDVCLDKEERQGMHSIDILEKIEIPLNSTESKDGLMSQTEFSSLMSILTRKDFQDYINILGLSEEYDNVMDKLKKELEK